jgi:histone H3/H4
MDIEDIPDYGGVETQQIPVEEEEDIIDLVDDELLLEGQENEEEGDGAVQPLENNRDTADDLSSVLLPLAQIKRLMKEAAPEAKFSAEVQASIQKCASLFLFYVSAAAQEIADLNGKSTMMPGYVNQALNETGFAEIADEVRRTLSLEFATNPKKKQKNS